MGRGDSVFVCDPGPECLSYMEVPYCHNHSLQATEINPDSSKCEDFIGRLLDPWHQQKAEEEGMENRGKN